jgi:hypothetical protein
VEAGQEEEEGRGKKEGGARGRGEGGEGGRCGRRRRVEQERLAAC